MSSWKHKGIFVSIFSQMSKSINIFASLVKLFL
jgi:hypothetical protein